MGLGTGTIVVICVVAIVVMCFIVALARYCCYGARREGYDSMSDASVGGMMWQGRNPTETKVRENIPAPVVVIDSASDAENRKYTRRAANYCRSVPGNRTITTPLPYIGYHKDKNACLIDDTVINKRYGRMVPVIMLSYTHSKDTNLSFDNNKSVYDFTKIITALQHPYVHQTFDFGVAADRKSAYVCREYSSLGSLKDFIYKVRDPKKDFNTKYPNLRDLKQRAHPMRVAAIAKFGRQVLEALLYFQEMGVPFENLHSGNVILFSDGSCKVTDYESAVFGFKSRYQRRLKKYKIAPQVSAFGLLLFEMANGYSMPLKGAMKIGVDGLEYRTVNDLLLWIFDKDSNATIQSLIAHPFFHVSIQTINTEAAARPDRLLKQKSSVKLLSAARKCVISLYPNCKDFGLPVISDTASSSSSSSSSGGSSSGSSSSGRSDSSSSGSSDSGSDSDSSESSNDSSSKSSSSSSSSSLFKAPTKKKKEDWDY